MSRETSTLRAAIGRAVASASTPEDLGELFSLLGELDAGINEVASRLHDPETIGTESWSVGAIASATPVSSQTIWNRVRTHQEGRVPRTVR